MLHSDEVKIKQYLTKYQNPEITRRDIVNALNQYRGLSCQMQPFVFNDGRCVDLLSLQGTIPVHFKVFLNGIHKELITLGGVIPVSFQGTTYNIPVCIWLMDTHPYNPPMCYVKPTSNMRIKISIFVDHNGKIYLPYLHDWVPNSSDLLGLIQVMIVAFGDQPPVYALASKPETTAPTPAPYPAQGFSPMPGSSGSSAATPYPLYPPNSAYPIQKSPYPYPPPSTMPYPSQPSHNQPHSYSGYMPTPPSHVQSQVNQNSGTGTITEEHIRASLLSAVEDKLRRRLDEQFAQSRAELDILQQTSRELTHGKAKLDAIFDKLDKEKNELERNITILKEKEAELEEAIQRQSEQEAIDVDEAVTTTAPLYKQILTAFAEEASTEDTIYYMGEALHRGVIDLDVFLKQVRALSRKQFMLRALMHKCRQKAGLAG